MGKRDKLELESRLEVLIAQMLKWDYQAEKRSDSWTDTIEEQRRRIRRQLKVMPSLRVHLQTSIAGNLPICGSDRGPPNEEGD